MSDDSIAELGHAIASRRIVREGRRVRWMYREEPAAEYDSGWRLFCDEEDAGDEAAFGMFPVSTVAEADPTILPFLHRDPPCALERDDDYLPLAKVTDWSAAEEED